MELDVPMKHHVKESLLFINTFSRLLDIFKAKTRIILLLFISINVYPNQNHNPLCGQANMPVDKNVLHCEKAFKDANLSKDDKAIVNTALDLSIAYQMSHSYLKSNMLLDKIEKQYFSISKSFEIKHIILRNKGKNHYFLSQHSTSSYFFQQALDIAKTQNDLFAMAKSYNDLGIVYKAQSKYVESLAAYKESLKIKEALKVSSEIGATLNNIGNLYLLLKDYDAAHKSHNRSLQQYLKLSPIQNADYKKIVHIKNQIGISKEKLFGIDSGIEQLEKTILESVNLINKESILFETYCNLAEYYLIKQQVSKAEALMQQPKITNNTTIKQKLLRILVISKIFLQKKQYKLSEDNALNGLGLAKNANMKEQVITFTGLIIKIKASEGQYKAAYQYQHDYLQHFEEFTSDRYNIEIKKLQNEIELHFQEKKLSLLKKNNKIQELKIKKQKFQVLSYVLTIIFLIVFIIWQIRKKRLEKKQLLAKIKYHRRKLEDLKVPKEKLNETFQLIQEPLVSIDQTGLIKYANKNFIDTFNLSESDVNENNIGKVIPELSNIISELVYDKDDFPIQQQLVFSTSKTNKVKVFVNTLHSIENIIVLSFINSEQNNIEDSITKKHIENINNIQTIILKLNHLKKEKDYLQTYQLVQQLDKTLKKTKSKETLSENYRISLINLMMKNLEVWRETTLKNRVELAQQSGIWKISIDDGRLRTRAMDRYLNIKTLPKSPRWRSVVKTSHYILSECSILDTQRHSLNSLLEVFMSNLKNK